MANDIRTIRVKRNVGSHEGVVSIDDAEQCADYLIKVRKVIYNFMSKIKPEYQKGFDEEKAPQS